MKVLIQSIKFAMVFFSLSIHAQSFEGIPVSIRNQELTKTFKHVEVYQLNSRDINDFVKRSANGTAIKLTFGRQSFDWKVYENNMLRPDFRMTTMVDGKHVDVPFDPACRTYIGYRDDMEQDARFTISGENFAAMIPVGDKYVMIQSLRDFIRTADTDLFVVYQPSDVITPNGTMCTSQKLIPFDIEHKEHIDLPKRPSQAENRTFSCKELEVAFATDNRMWIDYASTDAILNYTLSVMNIMEPFYNDFDFDFWVQDYFIVTSNSSNDNPWGTTLYMDDLKSDFEDWADDYFGAQDIGHLWTAGDVFGDEGNGLLGRADVGGACGDIGITPWTVLENFALNDLYELALLQAHEYGHLFDADHVTGGGTIMEPNFGNITSATWHAESIDDINSFIVDEPCIQSCIQCPIIYNIIDYIGWGDWKYSAMDRIHSRSIINGSADVVFHAANYIRLLPGFQATSHEPTSGNGTLIAKIAGCE